MNEAAISCCSPCPVILRNSKDEIYDALEMIIAGPEKKTPVVPEEKRRLVVYHGNFLSP